MNDTQTRTRTQSADAKQYSDKAYSDTQYAEHPPTDRDLSTREAIDADPYLTSRQKSALKRLRRFAHMMDEAIEVPVINYRIGLEPLIGLIPGLGDAAGAIVAAYVPFEAMQLGASWRVIGRMVVNLLIDALVGAIPLLGDLFDFAFKANRRNVELLEKHLRAGSL